MRNFFLLNRINVLLLLIPVACFSQKENLQDEYGIKTLFVYNFTKYIEWPLTAKKDYFEIDVVGESDIIKPLEELAQNKKINQKKIIVKVINGDEEITGDLVFIAASKSNQLATVIKNCKGKNVLIVTESANLATKGAAINFKVIDNKVRFELNQTAAKNSGLKLSNQLVELSIPVNAQ
ncbi:MAG: YfiR family protein [Bacteroidia bacterium]|nr:YfiR family protein [Bacteroidia bacterium]